MQHILQEYFQFVLYFAILEQRKRNPSAYWLTRFVLLRFLGVVYFTAFLVAANQAVPLIGHEGLLPADAFLEKVALYFGSRDAGFRQIPSIFWWNVSDACLANTAWVGVALSAVVVCGYANSIIMLVLWALYMSFVHVGQLWYSYGWETQLFIPLSMACSIPRPVARKSQNSVWRSNSVCWVAWVFLAQQLAWAVP